MRALLLAGLILAAALGGCFSKGADSRAALVPYPHLGDVATYAVSGAFVDFARWENAHALTGAQTARFELTASAKAYDGARALHPAFRVAVSLDGAKHADLYVDPDHEALVQSVYPLSQDQSVVAFDERGFPWLWGASALFGEDTRDGEVISFSLPDNLGRHAGWNASWRVLGDDAGLRRVALEGAPGVNATLWLDGSPWPARVAFELQDARLAPHVRADGPLPARLEARRVSLTEGGASVPPRDRGAEFREDAVVKRASWDGLRPPDGDAPYAPYLLGDALGDALLLDQGLQAWMKTAEDARLYRATFKQVPGPLEGTVNQTWLLQMVDKRETYYGVQMGRLDAPLAPRGVPRVESSGPAAAPASSNHGWFARDDVPQQLVPLSEGVAIVRSFFDAKGIQIFLRSFADPPGYSYFLDGGWDSAAAEKGRYTVVYNPATAFIEEATGPVTARLEEPGRTGAGKP